MGKLIILDKEAGHLELAYDTKKKVETARTSFNERKAQGYMAFRMDPKKPGEGTLIKEFDSDAEAIVMVPPVTGG